MFSKILSLPSRIVQFFRSVIQEMRLTEWLSRGEVFRLTIIIFVLSAIMAVALASADRIFNLVISTLLNIG